MAKVSKLGEICQENDCLFLIFSTKDKYFSLNHPRAHTFLFHFPRFFRNRVCFRRKNPLFLLRCSVLESKWADSSFSPHYCRRALLLLSLQHNVCSKQAFRTLLPLPSPHLQLHFQSALLTLFFISPLLVCYQSDFKGWIPFPKHIPVSKVSQPLDW